MYTINNFKYGSADLIASTNAIVAALAKPADVSFVHSHRFLFAAHIDNTGADSA